MGQMGGGMPAGGDAPAQGGAAAKVEVEAAPVVKTHYDVELTSFDAAMKIKLIKEVRANLGLGLKEAKETVESAPIWLKKELIKEEADKMKETLEKLGA
jgi:large subunit ribosomal protein L7/L12